MYERLMCIDLYWKKEEMSFSTTGKVTIPSPLWTGPTVCQSWHGNIVLSGGVDLPGQSFTTVETEYSNLLHSGDGSSESFFGGDPWMSGSCRSLRLSRSTFLSEDGWTHRYRGGSGPDRPSSDLKSRSTVRRTDGTWADTVWVTRHHVPRGVSGRSLKFSVRGYVRNAAYGTEVWSSGPRYPKTS